MANKRETKMDGLAEVIAALEKMGVDVKSKELQDLIKKESQCKNRYCGMERSGR